MKAKYNKDIFRSNCPVSSALDLLGDKWSLLIARELIVYGERTFKDFNQINEKISTARLSDRLSKLESIGILTKSNHPTNRKVFLYNITEMGMDLAPIIAEYISWGYKYLNNHISEDSKILAEKLKTDREGTLNEIMNVKKRSLIVRN
jgi:DNA-binding HxlR family transcriptional regulator